LILTLPGEAHRVRSVAYTQDFRNIVSGEL